MPKFLSVWIPPSSVCVSVFAHLHQLNILSLFKFSHSGGCVTVSQCLFVIRIFSFMLRLFKSYFSIGLFLSCWFVVACYQMDLPTVRSTSTCPKWNLASLLSLFIASVDATASSKLPISEYLWSSLSHQVWWICVLSVSYICHYPRHLHSNCLDMGSHPCSPRA